MTEEARVEVNLNGQVNRFCWPRCQSLVEMLLDAGIDVPHSCREGHCGSCVATLIEGQVDMPRCDILEPDDLRDGLILGCQARPVTSQLRIEF
jgi:3-ketosteroid 9alpha-monooxygenase subunit B